MGRKYGLGPYDVGAYSTEVPISYVVFEGTVTIVTNFSSKINYVTTMESNIHFTVNTNSENEYMGPFWAPYNEVFPEIWIPATAPNPAFRM